MAGGTVGATVGAVDFRILGPLEVWYEGRPIPVPGAKQRELLALLLLDAGHVVSSDRLMEELWGSSQPAAGATALRVRVSQLRKALRAGGDVVVTRPPGYALLVARDGLDLWRFERGLDEGERSLATDPQRALDALSQALNEWRGSPLVDVAYAPFAQAAVVRLEELRASALELRIEAELALGHHVRLIAELQGLTSEHPLRERLWAQLMTALYRDGRQADALAAYRTARARLVEEIGIEPGPELRTLEARILAQDPDLTHQREPTARPARAVLAVCTGTHAPAVMAERLAADSMADAVAVALVHTVEGLEAATARLRAKSPSARVAAFTTDDAAGDTVRLAAEQDAAILLLSLADPAELDAQAVTVLRAAPCDVALLAGEEAPERGLVFVPFAGHSHDWAAAELGAWLGGGAVTLVGVRGRDGAQRDASRLLASASLALQRGVGIRADTRLTGEGAGGVLEAATGAATLVVGLSERWQSEGLGQARTQLVREARCPVVFVRRGVRPGGLAPPGALTRFTWSAGP
jgi:DNA-binding SARP family transcriptional activator